ncbi:MAG: class II aldolase/adducin family protein [Polaromonas sp.]|nr:class II aldolase/adducin family protein [Polaromonas sp.]
MANHILFMRGVVDGFGHISVRHPSDPQKFLLSRSRAPALVDRSDIGVYDLDGHALSHAAGTAAYVERFIHSEIYRTRPDVQAIVHSHSPSVIPFGVTGHRLRPVFHLSGFLGSGSASFEMRDHAAESDLLIRSPELGQAVAKALANHPCVLMRGHGSTVVGDSIEQAVWRAVYTEVNATLQASAMQLGEVNYLSEQESALAATANDRQVARTWELWARELQDGAARHTVIATGRGA